MGAGTRFFIPGVNAQGFNGSRTLRSGKGARQELEDLQTGEIATIFNPRQQTWKQHFQWDGVIVVGLTATGRVTVEALDLNRATMLAIRTEEELLGRHPPG